ncbi:MAG TPA: SLBB domain-containing protein [Rhizomicrobium sp.]|nr:SLBB domain-containing protein [Rhizomicrobium sp.]
MRAFVVAALGMVTWNLGDADAQSLSSQIQSVLQSVGATSSTPTTSSAPITAPPAVTPSTQTLTPATPVAGQLPVSRLELLYSQRAGQPLQQFGYDIFGVPNSVTVAQVGGVQDNYVLGAGDQISIVNRGHDSNSYIVPVDRDGRLIVPGYDPVQAGGRTFGEVRDQLQKLISKDALSTKSYISLASIRQIGVLVTGEVYAPGVRTLSGLNTVVDALLLSGGVKKTGSLRNIILQRGSTRKVIDLYAMIANGGADTSVGNLTDGDRIIVPPLRATVAITGLVKRPGIYELAPGSDVMDASTLIGVAGGLEIAGTVRLSKTALQSDGTTQLIAMGHGGTVHNGEILSVDQAAGGFAGRVTIAGAVQVPGTVPLSSAPTLSQVLHDTSALLPAAYTPFAVVVRRDPATNFRTAKPFSLKEVFEGSTDLTLSNDDVIYIFTTDQVRALANAATAQLQTVAQSANVPPSVLVGSTNTSTTTGSNGSSSSQTNSTTSSSAPNGTASNIASALGIPLGGTTSGTTTSATTSLVGGPAGTLSSAPATTPTQTTTTTTTNSNVDPRLLAAESLASPASVSLLQAQNPQQPSNGSPLLPTGFGAPPTDDSPTDMATQLGLTPAALVNLASDYLVWVQGEVHDPGAYLAENGTSLGTMLNAAGGPALQADLSFVEVTSTNVDALSGVSRTVRNAYKGKGGDFEKVALRPLDSVIVRQVFSDRENGTITVAGQVKYPGTFDIMRDERLSSVLARAGGLTDESYPYGAVFTRVSAAQDEKLGNQREALQLQSGIAVAAANPNVTPGVLAYLQSLVLTLQQQPALGRITVTADPAILSVKPELDVVMQPGDFIYLPKRPSTVAVSGEVLNSGAFQYKPGLSVDDYIRLAGGTTDAAEDDETFIIFPDGTAQPASGNWFSFLSHSQIPPGSTIVVPRNPDPLDTLTLITDLTDIISKVAITAASLAVVGK